MDILSEEQQNILNVVKTGTNVMVDAVAGTGKTTLILSIAKELSTTKILQMTYNSSLRIDVKTKVANLKMENIRVHTFHSLA
ncbi:MAG: UvrD-helicase domain-containing protein, partial [Pseudomonadota bacterium]